MEIIQEAGIHGTCVEISSHTHAQTRVCSVQCRQANALCSTPVCLAGGSDGRRSHLPVYTETNKNCVGHSCD